ncbi:3-methyl-2-oxobutanoate hydroxymethyltransferase [Schaalia sp. lx-100]|uniref:3-methyl-2-oxobutanoate hydroxymethyltransferase n=1 Tax=Schaalia sp. lx-100 TaxID=2899081 RepID=UPI001E3B3281|nr:3-methyl-2-oxobutanoate hydroxymethyltransferase [Schaalia sp. lx-100]MCD4557427.1 3-methyl-2-oxobutanoate hydroxymethyltransferase [Schaalia sp. lx-100]
MSHHEMPSNTTRSRFRIQHFAQAKEKGQPITMLTAYDALIAPILEDAGIDVLLVGDSLGNTVLGYDSTLPVTLEDMERATGAVARSTRHVMVVADMPFGTYEADAFTAYTHAVRLMKAGAHAVKLEGGAARTQAVQTLVQGGIPVIGHLGYTPQSENTLGGPRMQGRGDTGRILREDAHALQEAGACAIVLEMVPADLARQITEELRIPTIGIGAGPHTDGQVLVWSDMAGMGSWAPSFVKRFGEIGESLRLAASAYVSAVREGSFPAQGHYKEQ